MSRVSREVGKYPRKVIWIFDVIGSYFVDQFYNHLYMMAKKSAEIGQAPNITDGYRSNVLRYHHGITTNAGHYKYAVSCLHEYYQRHSGQGTTTMADFEDQLLTQFIPDEFYDSFTDGDRNTALREVVVCIVSTLCQSVISRDILPRIIDDHANAANVTRLQQIVVDALCTRRDDYFVKFAKQVTRGSSGSNVDIDTFNALKAEFIKEKRARCDAEASAGKLREMLTAALVRIKDQATKITTLSNETTTLSSEISQLSAEVSRLSSIQREPPKPAGNLIWNTLDPNTLASTADSTQTSSTNAPGIWERGRTRAATPYPTREPSLERSLDILGMTNALDNSAQDNSAGENGPANTPKTTLSTWGLDDELW